MKYLLICAIALGLARPAAACIWDEDTIAMERARFPEVFELIIGRFPRHSEAYYQWRVEDRERRLEAGETDPGLVDDLAVAHDKLGHHDEAIRLMTAALEKDPKRYETLANLGTFYFHAGRLKEGLPFIEKALEVNPDAHFGRERYQLWLVEYVLSKQTDGKTPLPLVGKDEAPIGFWGFIENKPGVSAEAAVKGITGMMRFGNHRSPILLEALGDVLLFSGGFMNRENAAHLAAMAYLLAAEGTTDSTAQARYRAMAKRALVNAKEEPLRVTEKRLRTAVKRADTWVAKVHAREKLWIARGYDVDKVFQKTYLPKDE